jgi:release factor glutamine methyltransferase
VSVAEVRAVLADATDRLTASGVPSPRHDAEVLVALALGIQRSRLAIAGDPLDDAAQARVAGLVARRAAREPLQHLTGTAGFRWLDLAVGPGVFVPRPETELVAGAAVAAATARGAGPVVVDLCAGSGAIALAVATEVPNAQVHAVERDPVAAGWLQRNVGRLAPHVLVHVRDAATADEIPGLAGRVDVVVANPPYLRDDAVLKPEVADHDPPGALFGGPDGSAGPRLVVAVAGRLLRPGGALVVEHGDDQAGTVAALLAGGGWDDVAHHGDLAGRPRFTTATRQLEPNGGGR